MGKVIQIIADRGQEGQKHVIRGLLRTHSLSTIRDGNKRTVVLACPLDTLEWVNFWGNLERSTKKSVLARVDSYRNRLLSVYVVLVLAIDKTNFQQECC